MERGAAQLAAESSGRFAAQTAINGLRRVGSEEVEAECVCESRGTVALRAHRRQLELLAFVRFETHENSLLGAFAAESAGGLHEILIAARERERARAEQTGDVSHTRLTLLCLLLLLRCAQGSFLALLIAQRARVPLTDRTATCALELHEGST